MRQACIGTLEPTRRNTRNPARQRHLLETEIKPQELILQEYLRLLFDVAKAALVFQVCRGEHIVQPEGGGRAGEVHHQSGDRRLGGRLGRLDAAEGSGGCGQVRGGVSRREPEVKVKVVVTVEGGTRLVGWLVPQARGV